MFSMKKILAIAGAGAMLVSVAACGSGTAGDDGGKKEISFQTWNLKNDKYTPYFEALIKAYEKDHPDVTVKWLDAPSDGYEDKLSRLRPANCRTSSTAATPSCTVWPRLARCSMSPSRLRMRKRTTTKAHGSP